MTPVLLPGNMCDARLWTGKVRAVLPGAVDADLSRDDTIAGMAQRTLAATAGPLLPVGFSMGAIVALAMAAIAPERIVGIVLMGLNAGADLRERAARRPAQQAEIRAGGLERVLVEELKPNYLAQANRGDAPLLALLRDMGMGLGPEVFVRQSEALRTRADHIATLRDFPRPVLLACGAEDALCPPVWHERWAQIAQDPTLAIIDGAGHMLPLEAPERLTEMLSPWLTELPCPTVS